MGLRANTMMKLSMYSDSGTIQRNGTEATSVLMCSVTASSSAEGTNDSASQCARVFQAISSERAGGSSAGIRRRDRSEGGFGRTQRPQTDRTQDDGECQQSIARRPCLALHRQAKQRLNHHRVRQ